MTRPEAPYTRQDLVDALRAHLNPERCTADPERVGGASWPVLPAAALTRLLDRWRTLAEEHRDRVASGEIPPPPITPRMPWYTARALLAADLGRTKAIRLARCAEVLGLTDEDTDLYLGMLLAMIRSGLTAEVARQARTAEITVASMAAFLSQRPVEDLALLARAQVSGREVEQILASGVLPSREALATLAALHA